MPAKILQVIKKIFVAIGLIVVAASAVVLAFFGIRKLSGIGKVSQEKNWKKIPGTDTAVMVQVRPGEWRQVGLPVVDGEQITANKIKAIGVCEGGKINVEIIHDPVDRHGPVGG